MMKLVLELAGYFVLQGLDVEGRKGDCAVQARHVSKFQLCYTLVVFQ